MSVLTCSRVCSPQCQEPSDAQQSFSSDRAPTVWRIIPSFEYLIDCWGTMAGQRKYQGLKDALDEGIKSLHKWHGRVDSTSAGYFICLGKILYLLFSHQADGHMLVLDPNLKDMYFQAKWSSERYAAGMRQLEDVVCCSILTHMTY